ncbi:MAG: SDR family oxidoreductase [Candidatus Hodarchaeota archaeon]
MDLELRNKVALVAASSKGIGKAVAIELAKEGANIIICARNPENLEKTRGEILQVGQEVLAVPTDLTIHSQVQNLITRSILTFDKIDILVTNSGGPPSGGFLDFNVADWKTAIDLNLLSTIYLCKGVIPYMVKQKYGRVIMLTSISVKQPINGLILSNVTRAGVTGLAKSLANEFGKYNILINTVCPGYTFTQRIDKLVKTLAQTRNIEPEEIIQEWKDQGTIGRLGTPEEISNLVVFLASEKASYITGTSIQVDGGYVKGLI